MQAEQTTGEEGFNVRFHRIEADLDSIGRDLATAFLALAEQRAALSAILAEIRTEINTINSTLAGLQGPPRGAGGIGIIGGVGGAQGTSFVGSTSFFGQPVNVFQTAQGTLMLPSVSGVATGPADNPRVVQVTDFAKYLTDADVTQFFTTQGTVGVDKFVASFGDQTLDNGAKVSDVLSVLPQTATFASTQQMLDAVATAQGAAIRTSPTEAPVITASLGAEDTTIADVPVDRVTAIPASARTALVGTGVTTVGALAGQDAATVAANLNAKGIDVTPRDVAGWVGMTKTLVNIQ